MKALLSLFVLCVFFLPLSASDNNEIRVAIIGDNITDLEDRGEREPFIALLKKINENQPEAVFFTGNFIDGLEQSTSLKSFKLLEQRLKRFIQTVQQQLGNQVKIYPVIGNQTFVNTQAVQIFKDLFKITDSAPLAPYQWAYSVNFNHSQFIVLATGLFERRYRGYRYFEKSLPLLDWVEKELRTDSDRIKYRFIVGHLPAFTSRSTEGIFVGLDKDPALRNEFWNLLKENHVLAYFTSHEPIYDRSNRGGVWQVISGGAGNEASDGKFGVPFQRYILIAIPRDRAQMPVLKTIDVNGKVWDEHKMTPVDIPVHQLRISIKE